MNDIRYAYVSRPDAQKTSTTLKSYQRLSPTSNMVGVMVWSLFMLRHEASSPYNFKIQFPINTKFITHVENVALSMSMNQYCVISIVPPTGHRSQSNIILFT